MRSSRFAPWVLLGCLLFAANCGKDEAVPASGAVGHVVVVKGDVTAQRAGEEIRPVRVDDTVYADDTIATGEGASVEILLTHNGARWELGESAERRIDKGIAFRATKKGAGPLAAKEAATTAAAGRSTTREAADSVGTVVGIESDDNIRGGQGTANDDGANERSDSKGKGGKSKGKGGKGKGKGGKGGKGAPPKRPLPTPAPPASPQPPAPPQPSPEPLPIRPTTTSTLSPPVNEFGDNGGAAPKTDNQPEKPKKQMSPQARQIRHVDALVRKCHKRHGGAGTLGYAISATGALQITRRNASLGPVVQCLRSALKASPVPNKSAVASTLRLE